MMFMFFMLLSLPSFAADDGDEDRKIVYKQKTEIDFEGLEVEGVLQKPQGSLLIERKQASFNPLIRLRDNWNDQIEANTDEVK